MLLKNCNIHCVAISSLFKNISSQKVTIAVFLNTHTHFPPHTHGTRAYLGDTTGFLVPDHHNKVNIAIKQVT